ncbi:MAG TPA: MurT ligase domain-containing protein [Streptosporangiaceae bacterium]|nr:MurT ligase domain-containing protein [Streptosporangiaceae bacterium]
MPSTPAGRPGALAARAAAVGAGKTARALSRALHRGGGTTLPGHIAQRIDPGLVTGLSRALPNGCVLVTGTNGKTTTTRILAGAARRAGLAVITNPEGSNLLPGIATSLLVHATALGRLDVPGSAIGIFEVDEGAFPAAAEALSPRLVVVTNLFRDQLDRYFEVDFVARLWQRALRRLPASATVVLNADDPAVAYLGEGLRASVAHFGLDDRQWGRPGLEHAADSRRCPRCGRDLLYELSFYAHLGHYACKECGWRRPDPRFAAWKVEVDGLDGSRAHITTPAGNRAFQVSLAGLYNTCNALAAAAGASCLGVEPDLVQEAAHGAVGAFGRCERVSVGGRQALILLVKNPSGFNEGLRLVLSGSGTRRLLIGLNDNGPDGRDVSWIWDADVERCRGRTSFLGVCGQRARDLALRLKYAELPSPDLADDDVVRAFFSAVGRTPPGETLYVLITYTAMWSLRRELVRRGHVAPFWQQVRAGEAVPA